MNRRKCLQLLGSVSLLVLGVNKALAQGDHSGHGTHGNHGNHVNNGHNAMPSMSADMKELMPLDKMPADKMLAPLKLLPNKSPTAGLFQADLEAKPVKMTLAGDQETEIWAYNGQLPGPQIIAYEGDRVEIHFKNSLTQPTTLHWHGLPVPPEEDGNPQDAVKPGESRIYRFTLPQNCAGTYWYHPHPHGDVAEQVAKGLAGSFIVKAKNDPLNDLAEQNWFISDLRLNSQSAIPPNTMLDWMNGREGQFVFINGQFRPRITIKTGERIRICNACSARYFRLFITNCQWIVVGSDGGLLEKPLEAVSELLLSPAERVEVILKVEKDQEAQLISHYYDRQKMMVSEPHDDLFLATVSIAAAPIKLPQVLRKIDDLGTAVARKSVEFSETLMNHSQMTMGEDQQAQKAMLKNMFKVNGKTYAMDRIDLTSNKGDVEEWQIINNSHMDHPFHLHGGQFLIIKRELNGKVREEPFKAWKDTFNLRPYEKVTIKVRHDYHGIRMFHCHILEHETLGMMGNLEVI